MKLLKKDLRLACSPLTPLFLVFACMTLIPRYPILVGAFFICLGVFYSYQSAREGGDILFTVLLPIRKRDVVRSKYLFTAMFQLIGFAVMAILTALRLTVLRDGVYADNPLLAANFTFLAFALLIFLEFNAIFVGGFFKTAYYYGKPFVAFAVVAFLTVGVAETLPHLPGLAFLGGVEGPELLSQLPLLVVAVTGYFFGTLTACRASERRFEKLDL